MLTLPASPTPAGGFLTILLASLLPACQGGDDRDSAPFYHREQAQRASWDSAAAVTHRRHIPLTVLPDLYAICRLDQRDKVPAWAAATTAGLSSMSRTGDELSLVVVDSLAPRNVRCQRNWRALQVRGPLQVHPFVVISNLSGTLANMGVDIFALSTFGTDYVMVEQINLGRAERALRQAGYPFVAGAPSDSARPLSIKPVDEAVADPEFFLFRARVQAALAARDTSAIMQIVDPGILNSFGGDGGRDEFRQYWHLETPEKSRLWSTLGSVLALGGRFDSDSTFYAPYVFGATTGDGFESLLVLDANVPVHAGPGASFTVVDTVSFEEVTKWREKSGTQDWEPIRTRNGRTGWVRQRHLRSPIAYRAGFVRREGRWWLRALVAGD